MWSRVFGLNAEPPSVVTLAEGLRAAGLAVEPHFRGDATGWTGGELRFPSGSPILLERYLTDEDDLRDDLNAHAAELETLTYSPNHLPLMERVIRTKQLITLRKPVDQPDEATLDAVLAACCRFLAAACDGVYQVDGAGWFAADGAELVREY